MQRCAVAVCELMGRFWQLKIINNSWVSGCFHPSIISPHWCKTLTVYIAKGHILQFTLNCNIITFFFILWLFLAQNYATWPLRCNINTTQEHRYNTSYFYTTAGTCFHLNSICDFRLKIKGGSISRLIWKCIILWMFRLMKTEISLLLWACGHAQADIWVQLVGNITFYDWRTW